MQIHFKLLAAASLAACLCVPAHADIATITGTTSGGPTFHRAVEDFAGLSVNGTGVPYTSLMFTVSVAGDYTFLTTAEFDAFVYLYSPSFNPAAALDNAVIANDDLVSFTTAGFQATLASGTPYVFVVTGYENTDFGSYSTTVGGPGSVVAVPEPSAYLLMLAGLAGIAARTRRRAAVPVPALSFCR